MLGGLSMRTMSGGSILAKQNKMFDVFVTIVGVLMSLSYYPQAYKIWRNKSAQNVAVSTYATLAAGTLVWVAYGLTNSDYVIITSFSVGFVGTSLVLIFALMYKNK